VIGSVAVVAALGVEYVAEHTPAVHVHAPKLPLLGVATNAALVAVVVRLLTPSLSVSVTETVLPTITESADMLTVEVLALGAPGLTTTVS
jgi:hypothetical protein